MQGFQNQEASNHVPQEGMRREHSSKLCFVALMNQEACSELASVNQGKFQLRLTASTTAAHLMNSYLEPALLSAILHQLWEQL